LHYILYSLKAKLRTGKLTAKKFHASSQNFEFCGYVKQSPADENSR